MNGPEQFKGSAETNIEARDAAQERSVELQKSAERSAEKGADNHSERVEQARKGTEAIFAQDGGKERSGHEPSGFGRAFKRVTAQEKAAAYQQTMDHIRSNMSSPARAFSAFIHNRNVERASGVLGNSVARPNSILSGSTSALILVSLIYVIAKAFGYPLSGFETIGAFIIGWIFGIVYDYARLILGGRSS